MTRATLDERSVVATLIRTLLADPRRLTHVAEKLFDQPIAADSARIHPEVLLRIGSRSRRPDIILTAHSTDGRPLVAIVEAKTGSLEGADQTLDYSRISASPDFVHLSPPNSEVRYWFLTPDGCLPATATFSPITYAQVLAWIREVDPDFEANDPVLRWEGFTRAIQPGSHTALHEVWRQAFPAPWISGQDGNGNAARSRSKPLKAWRPEWVGDRIGSSDSLANCYHVHFEATPVDDLTEASLKLHLETHPYRSARELGDLAPEVERRRQSALEAFWQTTAGNGFERPAARDRLCLAKAPDPFASAAEIEDAVRRLCALTRQVEEAVRAAIGGWTRGVSKC